MPRQIRIEMEGGIYHVMARGDRREPIFHGDGDRWFFLCEAVFASDVRRVCVAAVVKAKTAVPLAWLAQQVGITSAANVSQQVRRLPDRLKRHPQIKRLYEEWKNSLS